MSYWWVSFIHPDEPKTRVNPDGIRTRLIQIEAICPLEADLDAFRERQGNKIVIVELKKSINCTM
jgi:hypothetical protein